MSSSPFIPITPYELACRFAGSDDFVIDDDVDLDAISEDDYREMLGGSLNDFEDRVRPCLDAIPPTEADYIELIYFHDKVQGDVAEIFQVSQAAVSYRLHRGFKRIRFLLEIPKISPEQMWVDLPPSFPEVFPCKACPEHGECRVCRGTGKMFIDVAILVAIWETSCQTDAAKALRLSQGRVRHRFMAAVVRLVELVKDPANAHLIPYAEFFSALPKRGFNLKKEVKLPQWAGRGGNSL